MANNLIQIKRSLTTAVPGSLANGELAYTANGDVLYIGSNGAVVAIGGKRVPGVLTANQSIVTNSTSGVDKIIVGNLQPTYVYANGASGTAGQYLTSNSSGGVYWNTPAAGVAGSDTQVQFNDGGSLAGDAGFTFNKTTDSVSANNFYAAAVVNAATVSVGTSLVANTTRLAINTAVGVLANGTIGTAGQTLHSNGTTVYWATDDQGVTSVATGNGLTGGTITSTGTISVLANNGIIANSTGVFVDGANGISVDAAGVNVQAANGTIVVTATGVAVNTAALPDTDTTYDLLAVTNTATNAGILRLDPSSGANDDVLFIGANGIVVSSNSTAILFTGTAGDIESVTAGNGLTGGGTSGAVTLDVAAGNGISVSADAVAVNGGSTLTVNSTGAHVNTNLSITSLTTSGNLTVNGNTKLGDASTDKITLTGSVNTSIIPDANVTYNLGSATAAWNDIYGDTITINSGAVSGNLTVGGDLVVTGNVTTVNVSSLSVSDPLIKLAVNNTTGDTLYIGVVGHYNGSGNTTNHAGIFREPTSKNFYLMSTYGDEANVINNTINVADPSFTIANLNTYLLSGGLVTNASHVAITANSTVNVTIAANSLTLSSPLVGTSGGTGLASYTAEDILVANSTNGFRKLGIGTSGYVLQSNGTALIYDTLDGGTF